MNDTENPYLAEPPAYTQKDVLYELYWGRYLSQREIGERLGASESRVGHYLREYGIPRRDPKQGHVYDIVPRDRGFLPAQFEKRETIGDGAKLFRATGD